MCAVISARIEVVAKNKPPQLGEEDVNFNFWKIFIGGDIQLTCTIHNGKEYPILWMRLGGKREPFPISTGPSLLVHDKRFHLENDPETGSYVLSIKDVQKSDEAKYCLLALSRGNLTSMALLISYTGTAN